MFYPGKAFLGSDRAFATSHISLWCSSVQIKTPLLPQVHSVRGNGGAEVTDFFGMMKEVAIRDMNNGGQLSYQFFYHKP